MPGGAGGEPLVGEPCEPGVLHAIASGLVLEPLAHPKPGAVTRLRRHGDKDIFDFAVNAFLIATSMEEACSAATIRCEGSIARGFRAYRRLRVSWRPGVNIALGSLLLYLPVAASLSTGYWGSVEQLARASRVVADCTGAEEAAEYYRLLEDMRPSHLGEYRGRVPGVGSGEYPESFLEVLESASWDHVHRELLTGYEMTREALGIIRGEAERRGVEEAVLRALLELLASRGDTLIAAKYGYRAYRLAMEEASEALRASSRVGLREALEWLDSQWRPRGWNPGAVLDIVSLAVGLYVAEKIAGARRG